MSHCLRVALLGKSRFLLDVVMAGLVYYLDVGRRRGESQNVCSFFVFASVFPFSKVAHIWLNVVPIIALEKVHRALVS